MKKKKNTPKSTRSNPLGLNLNATYYGRCKGKTAAGERCKHVTIFQNGFCLAHGGKSSPGFRKRLDERSQEIFEKRKRKLKRKIERLNKKWPANRCIGR